MEDAIQFHSARSTIEERTTSNIYEIERIDHSKQVLVSKGRRERLRREIRPILLPRATETRTKTSSLSLISFPLSLSLSLSLIRIGEENGGGFANIFAATGLFEAVSIP